jgi:hypothetical protein
LVQGETSVIEIFVASLVISFVGDGIDNVLVGDVILHARQTNIDISLGRDLAAGSDVPVGIVDINLGSAFVNGWPCRHWPFAACWRTKLCLNIFERRFL